MRELTVDKLKVKIFESRREMGEAAAADIRECMLSLLAEREQINMIFAAAPSQNDTLAALVAYDDIDWGRVNAFHMDEYIGLARGATQRFSAYLDEHIFSLKKFASVNYIDPTGSIESECARYSALLREHPVDIVVLGIGENGHIAFNDPGVADFNDKELIKAAELDLVCRNQQVNDGCFEKLDDVPTHALTLTVPALCAASAMFCSVPAKTKAWAVKETVTTDKVDEHCPATAMRLHPHAVMYCDSDSASELDV